MILTDKFIAWFARDRRLLLIVAFVLGAALVLSFAPFRWPWLSPVVIALLVLLWEKATPREAAVTGFVFGLGAYTAGTYWLYISLNILGGLWPPMAILLMFCLIAALSAYLALAGFLTVRLSLQAYPWVRWLIIVPALWLVLEWVRGWLFTGFPWLSIGYAFSETPLGAVAPYAGVYGVSWTALLVAGLLVALLRSSWVGRAAAIAGAVALALVLSGLGQVQWTEDTGRELNVSLVQGAIPQERKWRPDQLEPTLKLYSELTFQPEPQDLVVWPEAAIPALPFEIPEFLDDLHARLVERDTQLFSGILTYDLDQGAYLNTLWALGEEQGMYYKRHLVAFGEYFPLPDFAIRWLRIMNLPSESISPGESDQTLLMAKGVPIAASICYELAFGAEQLGFLPEAQLLVNVSNDAWFGNSIAPHQHLQIGQMRALETGRYLMRATNTGITAIIDAQGRVLQRLPQFQSGVLNAVVHPRTGATPYVRWGNTPVILLASLLLAGIALVRQKQRP